MKRFTSTQIDDIKNTKLSYVKGKDFIHCNSCIRKFLDTPISASMTEREYGMYEASNYTFTYPDGKKEDIVVIWCKRCGRNLWDSRNLVKKF